MKTKVYVKRISNDQLITPDGKQTIETYLIVDEEVSDSVVPNYTIMAEFLNSELIGWVYECTDFDKRTNSLVMTFTDHSSPEDYLETLN
ncbi:MAG: hypothetical protein JRJ00_00785 [Deltaproteobacteria bacterium]|nr:hypothetical protein [Deltaproteobacteria bacterium]